MILQMTKEDMSILALHMAIMRQNVRNGFKSNHGKAQGKRLLNSFDEVKRTLENGMGLHQEFTEESLEIERKERKELHFNIQEINMLSSFLDFYVPKFTQTLKSAPKVQENDQAHLDSLAASQNLVDQLKEDHKVG